MSANTRFGAVEASAEFAQAMLPALEHGVARTENADPGFCTQNRRNRVQDFAFDAERSR